MAESGITNSPHVDEGTMHAWLDGALSTAEASAVESHVAHCDTCSAAAAEARGLIAASTRILSALDDVPGGVIPENVEATHAPSGATAPASQRVRSMRSVRRYAPIAAVALFAIAATLVIRRNPSPTRRSTAAVQPVASSTDAVPGEADVAAAVAPAERPHVDRVESRPPKAAPPSSARVAAAPDQSADAAKLDASALESRSAAAKAQVTEPSPPAAVAAGAISSRPGDSVAITGRVTAAATGLPLAAAVVSVTGMHASAATDSNGVFTISKVPSGAHTLTARQIGFEQARAEVNVAAGHPANVTFALPQSSVALSQVVVTGVAAARVGELSKSPPTMTGARVVSSTVRDEGGSSVRRTVFQIDSAVTVTLVEYGARRNAAVAAPVQRTDTNSPAAHLMLRGTSSAMPSVMWISSDGTVHVLLGALPEAELEALKKRIVP